MNGGAQETSPALDYRFLLWLTPTVERFPRSRKFLPGDRIQSTALDVLESLIEATKRPSGAGQPRNGEAAIPVGSRSPPSGFAPPRTRGAMHR